MPVLNESTYHPPKWLTGGHVQTIYPTFRVLPSLNPLLERMELSDGDFLDIDWHISGDKQLAILCHGLEGNARSTYMRGMASALMKRGWDVLAWNYRDCGQEPNRLLPSYHSGKTDDLEHIVQHAVSKCRYDKIDLIGFSLGGNLVLKYIGERGTEMHPVIHRAVAFSAPCMLACSSVELSKWQNRIYMHRFLRTLRAKIKKKHAKFPGSLDINGLSGIRNFAQFDGRYTAPIHGFESADDYWARCSSRPFLQNIRIPTLLVNAANDPFLGENCYPKSEAQDHRYLHLEIPKQGGHVGFAAKKEYWSETRTAEFLAGV